METGAGLKRPTRIPQRVVYALLFTLIVVIIVLLLPRATVTTDRRRNSGIWRSNEEQQFEYFIYNFTYPLTPPKKVGNELKYKIGVVSDQDKSSKASDKDYTWYSVFKEGVLTYNSRTYKVSVEWTNEFKLVSHLSEEGRGVELSELIVYNGKLLTVDDRSGIIYEVKGHSIVPWVKLNDGPGDITKGFKGEWMAVKGRQLYVGGLGKEWTSPSGEFINDHPQYVKQVSPLGHVINWPWADRYNAMKAAVGIKNPGYIIHESGAWSSVHQKWFFLPRRASKESYNDVEDEQRATNIMITADQTFRDIRWKEITTLNKSRGFSSFKFLPGTDDKVIVALKSEENNGYIATYIMAFDLTGKMLLEETLISQLKFEGIEFL